MKKTKFHVQLFEGANKTAEDIALEAARYNAADKGLTIPFLHAFGLTIKTLSNDEKTSVELVGENTLHVDTKINDKWETVCIVEEIEVFELVRAEDFNQ